MPSKERWFINVIPKKTVLGLNTYQPGKPLEEVKRELGLENVIKMASNENPLGCSDKVLPVLIEEKDTFAYYPESTAPNLREKLAEHFDLDPRHLIVGNGSDEIVQLVARTYLCPGVESIMAEHTFPRYDMVTQMEGAISVKIPLTNGVHNLDKMIQAITENTRVVWICNPNNPTGTMVSHNTISSFLDQIPEHVLTVIDEAYAEYVTDSSYPDTLSLLSYNPRLLILRTFSKAYGLAAFRVGYGIGHPDVLGHLHRLRDPFNVNRLAQKAAEMALEDDTFISYCRNQNSMGRKQITTKLDEWGLSHFPTQASFVLFDTGYPADEVFEFLLHRGIIVRSGAQLGFPTHLRVTIGTKEQNEQFLSVFATFLQSRGPHDKSSNKEDTLNISSTRR